MANTKKDAKIEELSKQEMPEPVYTAEFSKQDLDNLEAVLRDVTDPFEHNDFVDQMMDNVEGDFDDYDWEKWETMDDIPKELLEEFDGVSSHTYRSGMLLYKVIAPLIRQRDLDLQEKYRVKDTQ